MHDIAQPEIAKPKVKSTRKIVIKAALAVLALFLILGGIKALQIVTMATAQQPMEVETVTSALVKEEDWAATLSSVGTVSAVQGAVIGAEVAGTVAQINFENGAAAKKGDLLVKLDTSAEDALLRSAEANAQWAQADLERMRGLAERKVVPQSDLDAAVAKARQNTAQVENIRAIIERKTIRAPFDGILGIRQVNVGQYVNAGQQVVPLQSLDSVYVDFALPQQRLPQLSTGLETRVRTDAVGSREFVGKLTAINPSVDTNTRNVALQATLANPDHALHPGMFAKVEIILPKKQRALVIPGTAVSYAPYGDSVYVIEKKKDPKSGKESQVIRQQFVRVGETRGDFVSVTKGLKAGETLVGTGVFKLRNGMAVTINNDLAPEPQVNPTPADT